MSTKHTPGPWFSHKEAPFGEGDKGGFRIDAPGVEQLAFTWRKNHRFPIHGPQSEGPEFGSDEAEANARLIAAAPELLEALEAAKASLERECGINQGEGVGGIFVKINAAINKARN